MSSYSLMLNSNTLRVSDYQQVPRACTISVILSTQNPMDPVYHCPDHVADLIPKGTSKEIIVSHYNQAETMDYDLKLTNNKQSERDKVPQTEDDEKVIHVRTSGKFTSSIKKGISLSNGQFILVLDADYPYPDELIPKIIKELKNSPNSIIIASKYVSGKSIHKVPFIRGKISKAARIVARHGLQVKEVQDPLSGCFAISSDLLRSIKIEGTGDEILLEILVKVKNDNKVRNIDVKEIPFSQSSKHGTKKLGFGRIMSYCMAVWHLYRYGQKSKPMQYDNSYAQQKRKSILFLSKAGRFFTVGASGLAVNYAVSYLLSNLVPNMWYIQATLIGIIVSITSNFLLNKVWTFEDRDFSLRHFFRQYSLFVTLCSMGAVIQLSLVYVFVEYGHIQYAVSLIMAVSVASLSNFLLNKRITFGEKIWG
jgi:dolichol-phosphate mannosyltransferase